MGLKNLKAAALGGLFAVSYVQGVIFRNRRRGVFIPKPLRQGITFDAVTAIYTEREFARAFRMSKQVLQELLDIVRVQITKNAEMGRRSVKTTVLADVRLAITIRILAGGDVWDIVALYHVKASTIHRIFEDTINALNRELKFPEIATTMRDLHKASMEFKTSRVDLVHLMDVWLGCQDKKAKRGGKILPFNIIGLHMTPWPMPCQDWDIIWSEGS